MALSDVSNWPATVASLLALEQNSINSLSKLFALGSNGLADGMWLKNLNSILKKFKS